MKKYVIVDGRIYGHSIFFACQWNMYIGLQSDVSLDNSDWWFLQVFFQHTNGYLTRWLLD
uniref:Uncharacterized protein n=1 Tax=Arion vulgaris TaxID=1028688 RepID=A0A0B7B4N0_9EUPU